MATKYTLAHYTEAHESELVNTMVKPYDPQYHTGMMVHSWGGWQWTHEGREYRTDSHGEGLWFRQSDGTWTQNTGTMQFRLPPDRAAALRILKRQELTPDREPHGHAHLCMDCGKALSTDNVECESDYDHAFERCDECAAKEVG